MLKLDSVRQKTRLNQKDIIAYVHDSLERYQIKKNYYQRIRKDFPQGELIKFFEKSRLDQIKQGYELTQKFINKGYLSKLDLEKEGDAFKFTPFEMPGGVSLLMVNPILRILGSKEQQEKWLPLLENVRVIGAYAQTELAHGSDVQNLQTEAVYNPKNDTFVINNRDIGSCKWWPGELGHLSNMVILFCKTIVNGEKIGVFPFIVQTRDLNTHKLLKGVEVGDIGPKLGYISKENGFMRFTDFEIPRTNLLNRFFDITREGELVVKGNPKILYASMMNVRVFLLESAAYTLGWALTVTLRYSNLRKQFKNEDKKEEYVINYQLQQHKLFPILAKTYAMKANYLTIKNKINKVNQVIGTGDFSGLQECHILLSGAKAIGTWWVNSALFVCMQSCGGHGYSVFSGIPHLIQNYAPNSILEGENTILLMQVGRYLLKNYKNLKKGKLAKLIGNVAYLKDAKALSMFKIEETKEFICNGDNLLKLFQKCSLMMLKKVHDSFGISDDYYNEFNKKLAIGVFESAKIHSISFLLDNFLQNIREQTSSTLKSVLTDLNLLLAVNLILEHANLFNMFDLLSGSFVLLLKEVHEDLLVRLKDDALPLAEAFVVDDYNLFSALGDSNEKPYENMYKWATELGVMNKVDLSDYYLKTIRKASMKAYPKL